MMGRKTLMEKEISAKKRFEKTNPIRRNSRAAYGGQVGE